MKQIIYWKKINKVYQTAAVKVMFSYSVIQYLLSDHVRKVLYCNRRYYRNDISDYNDKIIEVKSND